MTTTTTNTAGLDWEKLARTAMHPTQLAILEIMEDGDRHSPRELARTLDMSIANASHHVQALLTKKLIKAAGTAPRRGTIAHFYRKR